MYLIFLSGLKAKKVGLNLFMGLTYPYEFLPKIKLFKSCDQTEKTDWKMQFSAALRERKIPLNCF